MTNNNIKIEIEMKDSTTLFAVNRIIGYRDFTANDEFETNIHLADEEDNRHLIIFQCTLLGMEDVARIVKGISQLNLAKQEEEETEED
tara:strand:+ start:64 stop:327 length:264 start_codon:yes stop_codon:yes gene_type:complete